MTLRAGLGSPLHGQVNRRSVPALPPSQETLNYCRPATHRQHVKTMQAPASPNTQQAAFREVLVRPKSERALSPGNSATPEVRGVPSFEALKSFRLSHSGGQLSPCGSPPTSPQVPVKLVVSPPPPLHQPILGRRYVPQDFGQQSHMSQQLQVETKEPSVASAAIAPRPFITYPSRTFPASPSTSSLQASFQQNYLTEDARIRERSWDMEDPFYKLRQEIQTQCKLHAEMIRAEVSSLCNETGRRLQEEISKLRDAKDEEFAQVQSMLHLFDVKVKECQQKLDACQQDRIPQIQSFQSNVDLQVFQSELDAERMCRSDRISEVHDRINKEVSKMTKFIEDNRTASLEAVALEQSARSNDVQELRATLESMYQVSTNVDASASNLGKAQLSRSDDLSGDPEDIYTLYEMAREALGDTVHLRQLVAEERSERIKEMSSSRQQVDMLSRQLNTVQALLKEASAGANNKAYAVSTTVTDESLDGS